MTTGTRAVAGQVRPMSVAGSFYPGTVDRLDAMVRDLLQAADSIPGVVEAAGTGLPAGLLVPHAGLAYSGITAAAGWRQLAGADPELPLSVVILGTNHGAVWLDGIAAWTPGAWRTPNGEVAVDDALAMAILALGSPFLADPEAHELEHSIEVQLPLLQAVAPAARIVPLSVACGRGPWATDAGRLLGALLAERRAAGDQIVLAISTDMAHYPPAPACAHVTEILLPAILGVDASALADAETAVRDSRMRGLACGMCGIEPAVVGLAALRAMGAVRARQLSAGTSADAGGPPDRAVGYLSVRFDG